VTDLDSKAAEAMGWELRPSSEGQWLPAIWIDYEARVKQSDEWKPTTTAEDWWIFVKFMDDRGWRLIWSGRIYIGFQHEHSQFQYREPIDGGMETVFAATIRAGLQALGVDS